jgi:hypothetical protein
MALQTSFSPCNRWHAFESKAMNIMKVLLLKRTLCGQEFHDRN